MKKIKEKKENLSKMASLRREASVLEVKQIDFIVDPGVEHIFGRGLHVGHGVEILASVLPLRIVNETLVVVGQLFRIVLTQCIQAVVKRERRHISIFGSSQIMTMQYVLSKFCRFYHIEIRDFIFIKNSLVNNGS